MTKAEKMELALEAVLLFHSGSPWDEEKSMRWQFLAVSVLGPPEFGLLVNRWEATTRVLCDMVRAARTSTDGRPAPSVAD